MVRWRREAERIRSGERQDRPLVDVAAHAGSAFDGTHLYQIAEDRIQKIDPKSGEVLSTIPAPAGGGDSGMAWAEGTLWVGHYRERKIHQIDPDTGKILRTIESNRFVTGVTWVDGELWHGTSEGEESEVRRIDPQSGEVLEQLEMPAGHDGVGARVGRRPTGFTAGAGRAGRCARFGGRNARAKRPLAIRDEQRAAGAARDGARE